MINVLTNNLYIVLAEANVPAEAAPSPIETLLHSNIINFILVVIFLVWLIRKFKVFSVIAEKQLAIKNSIKHSEEEKVNAELELNTAKKRLSKADDDTKKIITDASGVAASLAERISKEAGQAQAELEKRAERIIESDKEVASNEVQKSISKAAFVIAEEHIRQAIDDRLHKKFIDDFINDLENMKI